MTESGGIPADRIPLSLFREILIWPLALHLPRPSAEPNGMAKAIDRIAQHIETHSRVWERQHDPTLHLPAPARKVFDDRQYPVELERWNADRYAEGVYFHEFVQSFLFRGSIANPSILRRWREQRKRDPLAMRLYQRTDITRVSVGLGPGRNFELAVERLNLYLFNSGSAVLVLEVSTKGAAPSHRWNLAEVLDVRDAFRRAYPPFARIEDGIMRADPQLVLTNLVWAYRDGRTEPHLPAVCETGPLVKRYLEGDDIDAKDADGRRIPPIFEHWRTLIAGALRLAPYETGGHHPRWHHVVDERIPTVATVAVEEGGGDPRFYFERTRRGDLVRLCFCDHADRDADPYDHRFLQSFERHHVYERFRNQGILYLASGYSFVAYGTGGFFENIIGTHMRRHYFQMALLAHFELATLLSFSTRISRAVGAHDNTEHFERLMLSIEDEFLQFVHRYRFTQVTNQLQGQELFDLFRRHLRLSAVFEDLRTEITSATAYLFNRAASRSARMTERLSIIATCGLILALAFGFLGMNVIVKGGTLGHVLGGNFEEDLRLSVRLTAWTVAVFTGLAWVGFGVLRFVTGGFRRQRYALDRRLNALLFCLVLLTVAASAAVTWWPDHLLAWFKSAFGS